LKWDAYGFVVASKYREMVTRCLLQHPKTPTQISAQTDLALAHVSRVLQELGREKLVVCINPNRSKGRVYELTDAGKTIARLLDSNSKRSKAET